jgi:ribosomal protein L11 methyltransferase
VAGIRLVDSAAFGTGLHPTTALCLDVIEDLLAVATPSRVLDVGTGSGILAIAALRRGVPEATGVDVDDDALRVAAENARLNGVADRLSLLLGGAEVVRGSWPLVVANVRSAELMEMAPALTRTIAGGGSLVLSGLPHSVAAEVERVYQRLGLRPVRRQDRDGWTALLLHASW